ncbi:DNA-binding protein [Sphingopyxis sp. GC21]|uniref:DNA-binding protein n=1 Tax=Sphingopyxis sp. GC21 TaxID=2933562 RepID=UPI0021E50301|nr:DNA-binding protein [Sphingopyxis sp. GC21]
MTGILFDTFSGIVQGKLSEHFRSGRILKLILHGAHAGAEGAPAVTGAIELLAIVNYPKLAARRRAWGPVHDRLRLAWERGEVSHPVRLEVESLESVNRALVTGDPRLVDIVSNGIALYQCDATPFKSPRHLSPAERQSRGRAEYARWYARGSDFLQCAGFCRDQVNDSMAALQLHQACELFYSCVSWSLTLYGLRTHELDDLRRAAEVLDERLFAAWPRTTYFERRAYNCIRRAYLEARYGHNYRITRSELEWAFERVVVLSQLVGEVCRARLAPVDAFYGPIADH